MNIYFINTYNTVKTVKTELCRLDRKAQEALKSPKRYVNEETKHSALKQNIKKRHMH